MNDKTKKVLIFWSRLLAYLVFAIVIPVGFLIWRFKLFSKISTISIGGWGIIAIIIVAATFVSMLKYIKKGLPFSFFTQCITGVIKIIIPLVVTLLIINTLKDSITELMQFLVVYIACQCVAIPVNPFPQWVHDNKLEEEENKFKKFAETIGFGKAKE